MGSNLTQKEINMLYDAIRNSIPDGAGSVMRDKLLEFLDTAEEFSSRLNAIEWMPPLGPDLYAEWEEIPPTWPEKLLDEKRPMIHKNLAEMRRIPRRKLRGRRRGHIALLKGRGMPLRAGKGRDAVHGGNRRTSERNRKGEEGGRGWEQLRMRRAPTAFRKTTGAGSFAAATERTAATTGRAASTALSPPPRTARDSTSP